MITIAYDLTLSRPGCAIVQRALGATIGNEELGRMNGWLLTPTPDMHVYPIKDDVMLEALVALTNRANPEQ